MLLDLKPKDIPSELKTKPLLQGRSRLTRILTQKKSQPKSSEFLFQGKIIHGKRKSQNKNDTEKCRTLPWKVT